MSRRVSAAGAEFAESTCTLCQSGKMAATLPPGPGEKGISRTLGKQRVEMTHRRQRSIPGQTAASSNPESRRQKVQHSLPNEAAHPRGFLLRPRVRNTQASALLKIQPSSEGAGTRSLPAGSSSPEPSNSARTNGRKQGSSCLAGAKSSLPAPAAPRPAQGPARRPQKPAGQAGAAAPPPLAGTAPPTLPAVPPNAMRAGRGWGTAKDGLARGGGATRAVLGRAADLRGGGVRLTKGGPPAAAPPARPARCLRAPAGTGAAPSSTAAPARGPLPEGRLSGGCRAGAPACLPACLPRRPRRLPSPETGRQGRPTPRGRPAPPTSGPPPRRPPPSPRPVPGAAVRRRGRRTRRPPQDPWPGARGPRDARCGRKRPARPGRGARRLPHPLPASRGGPGWRAALTCCGLGEGLPQGSSVRGRAWLRIGGGQSAFRGRAARLPSALAAPGTPPASQAASEAGQGEARRGRQPGAAGRGRGAGGARGPIAGPRRGGQAVLAAFLRCRARAYPSAWAGHGARGAGAGSVPGGGAAPSTAAGGAGRARRRRRSWRGPRNAPGGSPIPAAARPPGSSPVEEDPCPPPVLDPPVRPPEPRAASAGPAGLRTSRGRRFPLPPETRAQRPGMAPSTQREGPGPSGMGWQVPGEHPPPRPGGTDGLSSATGLRAPSELRGPSRRSRLTPRGLGAAAPPSRTDPGQKKAFGAITLAIHPAAGGTVRSSVPACTSAKSAGGTTNLGSRDALGPPCFSLVLLARAAASHGESEGDAAHGGHQAASSLTRPLHGKAPCARCPRGGPSSAASLMPCRNRCPLLRAGGSFPANLPLPQPRGSVASKTQQASPAGCRRGRTHPGGEEGGLVRSHDPRSTSTSERRRGSSRAAGGTTSCERRRDTVFTARLAVKPPRERGGPSRALAEDAPLCPLAAGLLTPSPDDAARPRPAALASRVRHRLPRDQTARAYAPSRETAAPPRRAPPLRDALARGRRADGRRRAGWRLALRK
ncbi:collagen alpha-1(I) chain-like [Candoia aspera]|uniref:collagen alpha-1(I) chain-like n=1 Tax=Candoia aspera TaxID=51853 RepID=UPI002FD7D6D1